MGAALSACELAFAPDVDTRAKLLGATDFVEEPQPDLRVAVRCPSPCLFAHARVAKAENVRNRDSL